MTMQTPPSDEDDLPDITALVAEMAEAPALPAHLEHLADRARTYVEAASSANTRRAYASD